MDSKLILDVQPEQISIALLEDSRLVELNKESRSATFSVGNVYLAKVKKLMPGLNAAFVDVGYEKEGFLHYLDLGTYFTTITEFTNGMTSNKKKLPSMNKVQFRPELARTGLITDILTQGKEILVQVTKEPISTKGPRLTSEISIAGRSLVLLPFSNKISISQKITSNEERNRLKKILQAVKPKNYGLIIRTVAEGREQSELENELLVLIKRWEDTLIKIQKTKSTPSLVVEEIGRAESILRDHFNPDFENIYINDRTIYEEIKAYISLIEPQKANIVKFYDDELPIFDVFNITKQIKSSFGRIVPFRKGAYLVVEHTEALHVIDVNSGTRAKAGNLQEENAFEVNMLAVDEVARQLRLRDMGGIVVIDLIDMNSAEHKQKIYDRMRENMQSDPAKHNVLPLTKFGLMQITRQRVRPNMLINTQETCPTCYGNGTIRPSLLFADALVGKIDILYHNLKLKKFTLFVHPYVYAYIKHGFPSMALKWKFKYGFGIKVRPNQDFSFLQYKFIDKDKNELDLTDLMEMA